GGLDAEAAQHQDPATFPGFSTELLAYHVQSDRWIDFGDLSEVSTRVTAPTAKWNGKWIVVNGEVAPGKRSPKVLSLSRNDGFGWLNWSMLILYLGLMVWI